MSSYLSKTLFIIYFYVFVLASISSKQQVTDYKSLQDNFCCTWIGKDRVDMNWEIPCFDLKGNDAQQMTDFHELIENKDKVLICSPSLANGSTTEGSVDTNNTTVAMKCLRTSNESNKFLVGFFFGMASSTILLLLIFFLVLLKKKKCILRRQSKCRYRVRGGIATRSRSFKQYRNAYPQETPANSRFSNRISALFNAESSSNYAHCSSLPQMANNTMDSNASYAEVNCTKKSDSKICIEETEVLNCASKVTNAVYENQDCLPKIMGPLGDEYSQVFKKDNHY